MQTEIRKEKAAFWVAFALLLALMLAVLELNHNTLWGWALCAAAAPVFVRLHQNARSALLRGLLWPLWMGVFVLVLLYTWPKEGWVKALDEGSPAPSETVTTLHGRVRGLQSADGQVEVFAGIPYAQPPVGELRWAPTIGIGSWSGTLICDHFRAQSMQPVNTPIYDSLAQIIGYHDYQLSLEDNYIPKTGEDSLYLNLWRPADQGEGGLPVLVFIHGGSLKTGQPWYDDYSGLGLARRGVIVVNLSYRLGVFGFFADEELMDEPYSGTTGNYGLLDQIEALRWVRENISCFGGDPDNVTLVGESAGAACVSALCVSPLAKGLFRRAILESSTLFSAQPPHSWRSMEEALESGREMKERLGVSSVAELRALSAETLVAEAETQHHITVDGYVLTDTPCEALRRCECNAEAILHGYNSAESGPFLIFGSASLKDYGQRVRQYFGEYTDEVLAVYPASTDREAAEAWAEIYGAVFFDYPHYCLNRLAAEKGIPVWEYWFSRDNARLGAWHSGEMVYFFGNIPEGSALYNKRDRELSAQMQDYWLNFLRTGDPNGEGLPEWEENTTSSRLMEFGDETAMTDEHAHALFAILDRMQGF